MQKHRQSTRAILLVGVAIVAVAFYLSYVTITEPYVGLNVKKDEQGDWVVTNVDPVGWASEEGIEKGDEIVDLNGIPPGAHRSIRKFGVIDNFSKITVQQDEGKVTYDDDEQELLLSSTLLYHTVIPVLVFVVLFTFSGFIYMKKRDDRAALMFSAFLLVVGYGYISAGASARTDDLARFINGLSLLMVPALFLHFLSHYFKRYSIKLVSRRMLVSLYTINLLIVLMDTYSIFIPMGDQYSLVRQLQLFGFSFGIFLCLYILITRYINYRKTIHKAVFQNMIFGIVISFLPFILLTAMPSAIVGIDIIPASITSVFLLFLPLFFLYLILSNRLFDIDFINSRIRYYSFLSLVFTVLIIGILVVATSFTVVQWIRIAILLYVSFGLLFYLEDKLHIRPKLFGEKFNYQVSLDRFSKDLPKLLNRAELDDRLIEEVKSVLPVNRVALVKYGKDTWDVKEIKGDETISVIALRENVDKRIRMKAPGDYVKIHQGMCFLVSESNDALYLLWVDQKVNHTPFNEDERYWLQMLAHYTSIVYENFQLIEGVTEELKRSMYQNTDAPLWLSRLLFNLSEKERARLASDLHDEALQEQLVWYRKMEAMMDDKDMPDQFEEELSEVKEGLLGVVQQIRETCTFLRPPFLRETGIVEALNQLMDYYRMRSDYQVDFHSEGFGASLDHEHSLAIYRVVQELLNNASKHSGASFVEFELKSDRGMIVLNYKDNGVGLPEKNKQDLSKGMGLTGIRQRVRSLEGHVEFLSSDEGGLELSMALFME